MSEKSGWGAPALAKKEHYFTDGKSLCGKWMFSGDLQFQPPDKDQTCITCEKKAPKYPPGYAGTFTED